MLPFVVFGLLLSLRPYLPIHPAIRFVIVMAVILVFSRHLLRDRPRHLVQSIALGIAVFFLWVGPDYLFPNWHKGILFNNSLMGSPVGTPQTDPLFLGFRIAVSVIAVPILEELFWRGWLMRWLIDAQNFEAVPLGKYAPQAFWIVAALFAAEHGSFWDVGLVTGVIYNWWMVRTRNLWDCIAMHAVTNGALAAYVVLAGKWEYWL